MANLLGSKGRARSGAMTRLAGALPMERKMEEGVLKRALRFVAAGGCMVAVDVHVAGFDVLSDAVGLALVLGGLSGLLRLPAATGSARSLLRFVQILTVLALAGSTIEELRPESVSVLAAVAIRTAPLVVLNGLCIAMWRVTTLTGRPRAAEAWRTTFSAVVSLLNVPAAVLIAAVAAGGGSMPAGSVGTVVGVVGALCAGVPLLHLLVVSIPRTVEPITVALAPVIDIRRALDLRQSVADAPDVAVR